MAENEGNNQPESPGQNAGGPEKEDHKLENIIGGAIEEKPDKLNLDPVVPQKSSFDDIRDAIEANLDLKTLGAHDLKDKEKIIDHIAKTLQAVRQVESGRKLGYRTAQANSRKFRKEITEKLGSIIRNNKVDIDGIYELIRRIVESTGPNRNVTQLLLGLQAEGESYLAVHTMDVVYLAISLGIEMTKLMEEKLKTPDVASDLKKIRLCTSKMFSMKDLLNIGVAAFLHDIQLEKDFPSLSINTKFDLKGQSKVERHPAEGYHFIKKIYPLIDLDTHRAIYQHHEYVDGSGFPNGTEQKFFGRYSAIVSFAVEYIEATTPNPFRRPIHPRNAIMAILTKARNKFDADVLMAFLRGSSMFPIGSWYLLNTGEIGYVCENNLTDFKRPKVRVVYNKSFQPLGEKKVHDLADSPVKILKEIPREALYKFAPDFEEQYQQIQEEEAQAMEEAAEREQPAGEGEDGFPAPPPPDVSVPKEDDDDIDSLLDDFENKN